MKVKDLKKLLENVNEDLQVRLVCDHGQSLMVLTGEGVGYIKNIDDYYGEEIDKDDLTGDESQVYILEAF